MPDPSPARLEALKRASTLQVLMRCARLVNERAIGRVRRQAGGEFFRPAIAALLPHIDHGGTRVTELARRVGVSKQAVSRLVAELEGEGLLETATDPADARARFVRFTPAGLRAIEHGLSVLAGIEDELAAAVGRRKLNDLRGVLLAMMAELEAG